MNRVRVCKVFTFDAAHQLIGHNGKCANVHGHTYRLEAVLFAEPQGPEDPSNDGFVMDFADLKAMVNQTIVEPLDHAFIAEGSESIVQALQSTSSKVAVLGFRSTAENLAMYMCHTLRVQGLPVESVKLWETPTSWAEALACEIPDSGPVYGRTGGCDADDAYPSH